MTRCVYIGTIVQTDENGQLAIIPEARILVEGGKILTISTGTQLPVITDDPVIVLEKNQFFTPGFIDCHIHAVQLPNIGIGYDKDLLNWLETYTFPLERKYVDSNFAEAVFEAVVKRTLSVGTTTACYFASLYNEASCILAKKASQHRQRAFIGKINMDCTREDGYYESTEDSVNNTKKFIDDVTKIGDPMVQPIITPRFALSCSMKLMSDLGKIAKDRNLRIQTHVSENLSEIEVCKNIFKDENCSTYSSVYEAAGLLTAKTILAHGVHLEDCEVEILEKYGTAVIHCPSSNTCLKSGLCDVQRLRQRGLKVGLGTDVAGGQSVCMLDAMRAALQVSTHLSMMNGEKVHKPLDYVDVLYLATLGGAKALAIDDQVGSLMPGKQFDALVIDVNAPAGLLDDLSDFSIKEKLQRLIYSGDDRNILGVYVAGHKVK